MSHAYYPAFLNIANRRAVVIGGNHVADEKVRGLLAAGCRVRVVTASPTQELEELAQAGHIQLRRRDYREGDLRGAHIAFTTEMDSTLNARVWQEAEQRRVLLNAVDDTQFCHFIAPAIHCQGDVVVAISSSGRSPALASYLRERIARVVGEEYGQLAALLGGFRQGVRELIPDAQRRAAFWKRLVTPEILERLRRGEEADVRRDMLRAMRSEMSGSRTEASAPARAEGTVYLVGAGPGAPDLLTLRALELIRSADVIVYDRLVHPAVLGHARPDASLIYVGKSAGEHTVPQDGINALLMREARAGRSVVRLKGGDPFVFGRGGEEAAALRDEGIACVVVPGISSAIAAPAAAGIPVTHREHASSFAVVTGHTMEADTRADWAALARLDTVVVLMGLGEIAGIARVLQSHGRNADTPVAAIASGTLPEQQVVIATLGTIANAVHMAGLSSPVTFIVGDVVRLGAAHVAAVAESAAAAAL